jgi:hypothetical protein
VFLVMVVRPGSVASKQLMNVAHSRSGLQVNKKGFKLRYFE